MKKIVSLDQGAGDGEGDGAGSSASAGDLLRASIAANESDLVAYTHEHDTGSKDRPGREFSVVRGGASAASVGSVDSVGGDGVEGAAAPAANVSGAAADLESGPAELIA